MSYRVGASGFARCRVASRARTGRALATVAATLTFAMVCAIPGAVAFGSSTSCAPVFSSTSGIQSQASTNTHVFARGTGAYYVRARVTTPSSFPSTRTLFLWGATASDTAGGCGGLRGGILSSGRMYMDCQCNSGVGTSSVPYYGDDLTWTASTSTEYVLEWYHDSDLQRTRFFVDGEEITARGGSSTAQLYPYDGWVSVGFNEHDGSAATAWGDGTVHEIDFYDCAPMTYGDTMSLKSAVNACLSSDASGTTCGMHLWNVGAVTSMAAVFSSKSSFNQRIDSWDVSSVTDMASMFMSALAFNQPLGAWDVSSVTNMDRMFSNAGEFNQDIGAWDVSSVTRTNRMFMSAVKFNQDIGGWDVSSVTDMTGIFSSATSFNQNVGGWNVSSVTLMTYMFQNNPVFNQDIGGWDVSTVTDMMYMFAGARAFNQPIGAWDVSSVTNMYGMFTSAYKFNQDISAWDVSSVTDMTSMFSNAGAFKRDLTGWSTPSLTSSANMFNGATAWGLSYANCGFGTPDTTVCTRASYPTSTSAVDGPPSAWHPIVCVLPVPASGDCGSTLARGASCPTSCDPDTLAVPTRCDADAVLTLGRCLCTCEEKMERFGFVFAS